MFSETYGLVESGNYDDTDVCPEAPFSKNLRCVETSTLVAFRADGPVCTWCDF